MVEPWKTEPDYYVMLYKDYLCVITRSNSLGHLRGYVAVPHTHVWGEEYPGWERFSTSVHEGITYVSDSAPGDYVFPVKPGHTWVGFDCGHGFDFTPYAVVSFLSIGMYRTFDYVKTEMYKFVEELDAFDKAVKSISSVAVRRTMFSPRRNSV